MIINSFFTFNGDPAIGLTPAIKIWKVSQSPIVHTLVVDSVMPVETGDGFYSYDFVLYDVNENYLVRTDGGVGLPAAERYNTVAIDQSLQVVDIVNGILDEPALNHSTAGSIGELITETHADVQQCRIDLITATNLVGTLLKYEQNRTKVDKNLKTLTIYDNDGITPIKIFNLRDSVGNPSVTEICERVPV